MKGRIVILLLIAVSMLSAASLSLHDAQLLLFKNNYSVRSASLECNFARAQFLEAKAVWLPSFNVHGSFSWLTEKNRISMSFPDDIPMIGGQSLEQEVGTRDRTELGIDMTYPIFTGLTRGHHVAVSRQRLAAREDLLSGTKNRLSLQLGLLYLEWQLSFHETSLHTMLCRQLATRAGQLEQQYAAGTIIRSRLLDVKARKLLAEVELQGIQQKSDSLRYELATLIGAEHENFLTPDTLHESGVFTVTDTLLPSKGARPEVAALEKNIEQINHMKSIVRSRHIPTLAAVAGLRYGKPGLGMGTDSFMGYGLLGLQLSWNLFSGFKGTAIEQQLGYKLELIAVEKEKTLSTLNKEYILALQQLDRVGQRRRAAIEAVKAAEALVADLSICVDAGTATPADYLDALAKATKVRMTLERINTAHKMAILRARFAAGNQLTY